VLILPDLQFEYELVIRVILYFSSFRATDNMLSGIV